MMLHKHDPDNLKPCSHMEDLISAWVDGKLTGLKLWYTRWHVSQCPRCTSAIPVLEALQGRLHRLAGHESPESLALTPERRAALEAAWEQADRSEEVA